MYNTLRPFEQTPIRERRLKTDITPPPKTGCVRGMMWSQSRSTTY